MARIPCCCGCGVRPATVAPIRPLAWERLCVQPAALKSQKKKPKKPQLSYDPAISFLGMYPKELKEKTQTDICKPTFRAATAKRLKQPEYPSTDEWINKTWYIHEMDYYTALKRKDFFFVFCLFRAIPSAYGDSQARGLIRAVAANLHQSHSNTRSEPVCNLYHSSRQRWILNPLREDRDLTCNLMVLSWIHFCCATKEIPRRIF